MSYNPFSLNNKVILVTGASSGIGRQCAVDCAGMGASVAIIGRNQDRLTETLQEIEWGGQKAKAYTCDLSNLNSISTLVEDVVSSMGKIDGFIHAAGIEITKPVKLLKPSDYEQIFTVNTLAAAEFARVFSNKKHFNDSGSIVFISSITSIIARKGVAAYAASKGALNSMARVMAAELANKKIRVNSISPGTILTPLMQGYLDTLSEEDKAKRIAGFPLGLGECSDISNACIYLLSDASRWVTGQNLVVDGGYTSQ